MSVHGAPLVISYGKERRTWTECLQFTQKEFIELTHTFQVHFLCQTQFYDSKKNFNRKIKFFLYDELSSMASVQMMRYKRSLK